MGAIYTETVFSLSTAYTDLAVHPSIFSVHAGNMGYGSRIKSIRKQRGLTQGELAALVGVEQPTIQRWESGAREPSFVHILSVCESLQTSPSALFSEVETTDMGATLYVKGEVAAGVWRESWEFEQDQWTAFIGRSDIGARIENRFGLRVVGESMNEVYPVCHAPYELCPLYCSLRSLAKLSGSQFQHQHNVERWITLNATTVQVRSLHYP